MLFLNDTISLQHSKIVSKIFSQHARDGLVSYLNLYGNLYYGHIQPEVFMARYRDLRDDFIARLVDGGDDVAHNLCMIDIAQREAWHWPGLVTELNEGLFWRAGNSRMIATGLIHNEPWTKLPVLILQCKTTAQDAYLYDAMPITTDEELHKVLGLEYRVDGDYYHPEVEIQAELIEDSVYPKLVLKYVGNKAAERDYPEIGEPKLTAFREWHQRYGVKPKLHVYADSIEQVVSERWEVIHMGPMPDRHTMIHSGHLERVMLNHASPHEHTLYVPGKRRVFADDILTWMDIRHTAFVDKNWDFAIYRQDKEHKVKMISITEDMDKY
jgi:hypothetical protein